MKVRIEKFRPANVGRIFVSGVVIIVLYAYQINHFIFQTISFTHFLFSLIWFLVIESELIIEKKSKYFSFTPLFLDMMLGTILMYLTGNIFSYFAIGYIVLTAISSISPRKEFGFVAIFLSILFFSLMGLSANLGILPIVNIFSDTTSRVDFLPLLLGVASISSATIIVNYITTRFVNDITKLNFQMRGQKKKLELYLKEYKKDLNLAKSIQRSLLNTDYTPKKNLDIKIKFLPMNEVGGDIYDIYEIKEGLIRVFLADATGHGVQAALITMAIKSEYENFKSVIENPGDLLQVLNSYFMNKYKSLKAYFSCIVADIYLEENYIRFASAGHPSQICFLDNQIMKIENTGKLMGLSDQVEYSTKVFHFSKPIRFLFFSDGIFESFTNVIDPFGEDSFHKYLLENPNFNTDKLVQKIDSFKAQSEQKDDIILISIKIT